MLPRAGNRKCARFPVTEESGAHAPCIAHSCACAHERQRAVCNRTGSLRGGARAHGSRGSWHLWACVTSRDVSGKRPRSAVLYEAGERTRRFTPALSRLAQGCAERICAVAQRCGGACAVRHTYGCACAKSRAVFCRCVPAGLCACVLLRAERQLLGAGGAARL